MAQFLRPDSDVSLGSWTGGYVTIDEATRSDTDFTYSQNNPNGSGSEVGLSDPGATPGSGTCTVRYAYAKVNAGVLDNGGTAVNVAIELREGATVIASNSHASIGGTAFTAGSFTFAASAITDWTNLRVFLSATGGGGSPANRRGGAFSWVEVETPDGVVSAVLAGSTRSAGRLGAGSLVQKVALAGALLATSLCSSAALTQDLALASPSSAATAVLPSASLELHTHIDSVVRSGGVLPSAALTTAIPLASSSLGSGALSSASLVQDLALDAGAIRSAPLTPANLGFAASVVALDSVLRAGGAVPSATLVSDVALVSILRSGGVALQAPIRTAYGIAPTRTTSVLSSAALTFGGTSVALDGILHGASVLPAAFLGGKVSVTGTVVSGGRVRCAPIRTRHDGLNVIRAVPLLPSADLTFGGATVALDGVVQSGGVLPSAAPVQIHGARQALASGLLPSATLAQDVPLAGTMLGGGVLPSANLNADGQVALAGIVRAGGALASAPIAKLFNGLNVVRVAGAFLPSADLTFVSGATALNGILLGGGALPAASLAQDVPLTGVTRSGGVLPSANPGARAAVAGTTRSGAVLPAATLTQDQPLASLAQSAGRLPSALLAQDNALTSVTRSGGALRADLTFVAPGIVAVTSRTIAHGVLSDATLAQDVLLAGTTRAVAVLPSATLTQGVPLNGVARHIARVPAASLTQRTALVGRVRASAVVSNGLPAHALAIAGLVRGGALADTAFLRFGNEAELRVGARTLTLDVRFHRAAIDPRVADAKIDVPFHSLHVPDEAP